MTAFDYTINNKNSIAELIDNEIFYIKYVEDTYSDVDDFKEGYASYLELTNRKPVKVLIEMCEHATISSEAREYAQANKIPAIAEALVLHSLGQRILINFYIKFRKQEHPIKIFKNFDYALLWLKSI